MSIAVVGSINIDLTTYSARLPKPGETLHGRSYALGLGGKGCNQAIAAARLGAQTILVGRTGQDQFAQTVMDALIEPNLSTQYISQDPEQNTGMAVISVDDTAENCITVIAGANAALGETDIDRASTALQAATVLLLQLETPLDTGLKAADLVRAQGGCTILDPAPVPKDGLPDTFYPRVDVITPNETETDLLVGITPTTPEQAQAAAQVLRAKGVGTAIIKMGAKGVYFQSAKEDGFVPPFPVKTVDSVAAGDCFNGGLAFALAAGHPISTAVRFAAACGALSTTRQGAAAAAPTYDAVTQLLSRAIQT